MVVFEEEKTSEMIPACHVYTIVVPDSAILSSKLLP
jgi:hypothetical protein